jgi:hypothetical protein
MAEQRRSFLKDNAFLVAAGVLPVIVAGFFVLANAIPRWTVPDPQYDLVMRAERPYQAQPPKVLVEYFVRNGQVHATVRPAPENSYIQSWGLLVFEHASKKVREVPVSLPEELAKDESRTFVIEEFAGRRVSNAAVAPDGYQLTTKTNSGGGLVGDLFGMGRYRQRVGLTNSGRLVPLEFPAPYTPAPYPSLVMTVGWIVDGAER